MKNRKIIIILASLLVVFSVVCFSLTIPWVSARWEAYAKLVQLYGKAPNDDLNYALLGTFISICTLLSAIISIIILILEIHSLRKKGIDKED